MPERPRQHVIEDLARSAFHSAISRVGWTSENLSKDYGEDLLVRIFEDGKATPWAFFVQSKATDRLNDLLLKDRQHIAFQITSEHAAHWNSFWEPVVLAIFDASTGHTYWEVIQSHIDRAKDSPLERGSRSITVHVPLDNQLDDEGIKRLRNRTKARFQRFAAQKEGARILLEELRAKWNVKIEYDPEFGLLMLTKGEFRPDPSGDLTLIPFGKFATMVDHLTKRTGLPPDRVFREALRAMRQVTDAFASGSTLAVMKPDGSVVEEYKTISELMRHVERRSELDDDLA